MSDNPFDYEFRKGKVASPDEEYPYNLPQFDWSHQVVASHENRQIAQISWKPRSGEIKDIFVEKPYRRQGLASELFRRAHHMSTQFDDVVPPRHSEHRTEEGDAWAKAVGGEVPPLTPHTRQFNNLWNE